MDWLDLLSVSGDQSLLETRSLKSLLQHHSTKASILQHSAFFIVQLSHPYMTTGKTIALTKWTFADKVMSLLLNMLSRLVITFLPRSKCLLIRDLETRDLFKKIRDTKGTLHAKMGSIKDRNCMDLTEAEDIKKRWQEYSEELYKKDLHDPDNHNGVITHLEPDILECEVKWKSS